MKVEKKDKKEYPKRYGYSALSNTRFYRIWRGIIHRCTRPATQSYKYYGAKGIRLCDRWNEFNNFKEDMFASYEEHVRVFGEKNTTIDRIDSTKNYSKENCRWATNKEQSSNRNINIFITIKGETMILKDWARKFNRDYKNALYKYHKGVPAESIFAG